MHFSTAVIAFIPGILALAPPIPQPGFNSVPGYTSTETKCLKNDAGEGPRYHTSKIACRAASAAICAQFDPSLPRGPFISNATSADCYAALRLPDPARLGQDAVAQTVAMDVASCALGFDALVADCVGTETGVLDGDAPNDEGSLNLGPQWAVLKGTLTSRIVGDVLIDTARPGWGVATVKRVVEVGEGWLFPF
ncbi:MAG: hypothetical protein M1833_005883 [Piccolia ochrophora]|nr:MAG: hypothetical protein M1833_005883 [Piccolia ochrophora]